MAKPKVVKPVQEEVKNPASDEEKVLAWFGVLFEQKMAERKKLNAVKPEEPLKKAKKSKKELENNKTEAVKVKAVSGTARRVNKKKKAAEVEQNDIPHLPTSIHR